MVKLTIDMLIRKKSGQLNKKRDESLTRFLKKQTHLNLENRQITEIGAELKSCPNLLVLYLYDNQLTTMPDLTKNIYIEAIYIQNNCISRIQYLDNLSKLKKIYLGHNHICVLEGFETVEQLEELNIECQKLAPGDSLIVDPFSVFAFSKTLKILNVAGDNLTSIAAFESCVSLRVANFTNNFIDNLAETADVISKKWFYITKLDFSGNPICSAHKYRDEIILAAINTLEILDEKEITENTKQFLRGLKLKSEPKNRINSNGAVNHIERGNNSNNKNHTSSSSKNDVINDINKDTNGTDHKQINTYSFSCDKNNNNN
ncbi:hypothetical protein HELRODRAFT_182769 [Helobdella robusta]|uniref:Dynein assembly factor 1, axonemal homolog n=1 Tax=Helobdella robusta TaxID=6412 RepID=T1FIP7_HELRO|nr:hypothetical protein HELRODRAFT_182769 [Helobdella robusta]ESN90168.1 hypothetical protein HELRODRAFT_182769 [Helobdella robusta]